MKDPVDAILDGLLLRSSVFAQMQLRGEWGFSKPRLEGSPFYILTAGRCEVRLADGRSMSAGELDVVVLPTGDAHDLVSSSTAPLVSFKTVLAELGWDLWTPGEHYKTGLLRYGSGEETLTTIIAGVFDFEDFTRNPLLLSLPRIMHLQHGAAVTEADDQLAAVVRFLVAEVEGRRPGSGTVARRLADVLFVHAVRSFLRQQTTFQAGWCKGIQDPRIGRALAVIHDEPSRPWTVGSLAVAAGMSRARFASRFLELVGQAPITYLTDWRMHRAAREVADDRKTLTTISFESGYGSKVAFSKAFKRWSGLLPRDYRRATMASAPGAGLQAARNLAAGNPVG